MSVVSHHCNPLGYRSMVVVTIQTWIITNHFSHQPKILFQVALLDCIARRCVLNLPPDQSLKIKTNVTQISRKSFPANSSMIQN